MNASRGTYHLIGDPVHHSRSPAMYEAAFRYLGIDATYVARRVPAGMEDALRSALRESGSSGGNVTVPHKQAAARLVDALRADAGRTGAVNCYWPDDSGRLIGDNTDVGGFRAAVGRFSTLEPAGASVLLLGAGGAARAVFVACEGLGVSRLDVLNRTPARAKRMIDQLRGTVTAQVVTEGDAMRCHYDLVVNATSLGLLPGQALPVSLESVATRHVFDLVYASSGTEWTRHARSLGVPEQDGLVMLAEQAILALDRWFGCGTDDSGLHQVMLGAALTSFEA